MMQNVLEASLFLDDVWAVRKLILARARTAYIEDSQRHYDSELLPVYYR